MLIIPYQAAWANHFEQIKKKLLGTLPNLAITVEHIGSTSVPLLAAKDIIDIDLIYKEDADFDQIKTKLENFGYSHKGNQDIEGREVFKRNGTKYDEVLDTIAHHLYVCKYDCGELQRHILFRDYLRKHDFARNFYQNLKYELAKEANNDRKVYANDKELKASSFINYIVELSKSK
jgi:GrpB-like predicted nucleotidyltransferase (UPF0157 family)